MDLKMEWADSGGNQFTTYGETQKWGQCLVGGTWFLIFIYKLYTIESVIYHLL